MDSLLNEKRYENNLTLLLIGMNFGRYSKMKKICTNNICPFLGYFIHTFKTHIAGVVKNRTCDGILVTGI